MYLFNIKLWNFRKFGSDSDIDLEKPHLDLNFTNGINVLIGENDSGKNCRRPSNNWTWRPSS